MSRFLNYFEAFPTLSRRVASRFECLEISQIQQQEIMAFLEPISIKDPETYEHSLRVGLLASSLCEFMNLDPSAGFYAGLFHEIDKPKVRFVTLQKKEVWTPDDTEEIKKEIMSEYRMLCSHFDLVAEIIVWHHRYQPGRYPAKVFPPLNDYPESTRVTLPIFGRLLSLSDAYDAFHQVDDRHAVMVPPSGESIKKRMLKYNSDQKLFIELAYREKIFTTRIHRAPTETSVAA